MPGNPAVWWTDDAIEAGGQDALGRLPFAQRLAALIQQIGASSTSSTVIGVTGPWGSGKTSTVNMALGELDPEVWLVERLNPWALSGPDAVTSEVFRAIAASLPPGELTARVKHKVLDYGRYATSLASTLVPGGALVGGLANMALDKADEDRQSLTRLAEEAGKQLALMEQRVLLFIDDMDRLQPEELLATFRAIRVLGRLPNVHYLLAYDQATLLDVLSSTSLANGEESRALAYLEKMVTVRLDQPPTRPAQIEELLSSGLDAALSELGVVLDDEKSLRLSIEREHLFVQVLREPRKVTRFLAQVHGYLPLVEVSDVDVVDFLVLSLLRLSYPRLYEAISTDRTLLTGSRVFGTDPVLAYGGDNFEETNAELSQWAMGNRVRDAVGLVDSAEGERVRKLLQRAVARMFPAVLSDSFSPPADQRQRQRQRRASEPDIVDRYFDLNAGAEPLSDTDLLTVMREWAGSAPRSGVGQSLMDALYTEHPRARQESARLLRRMRAAVQDLLPSEAAAAFVSALGNLSRSNDTNPTREAVAGLMAALLVRAEDRTVDVAQFLLGVANELEIARRGHSESDRWRYTAVLSSLRHSEWDANHHTQLPVIDEVASIAINTSWLILEQDLRAGDLAPPTGAAHALAWLDQVAGTAEVDRRLGLLITDGLPVDAVAARFVNLGTDPSTGSRSAMGFEARAFIERIGLTRIREARSALQAAADLFTGDEEDLSWSNLRAMASQGLLEGLEAHPLATSNIPVIDRVQAPGLVDLKDGFVAASGSNLPDLFVAAAFLLRTDEAPSPTSAPWPSLDESTETLFVNLLGVSALQTWAAGIGQAWHLGPTTPWTRTNARAGQWVEAQCQAYEGEDGSRMLVELRARLHVVPGDEAFAVQVNVAAGLFMQELGEDRKAAGRKFSTAPLPAALSLGESIDLIEAVQQCRSVAIRAWDTLMPNTRAPRLSYTQVAMRSSGGLGMTVDMRQFERVGETAHVAHDAIFMTERTDLAGAHAWSQTPDDRTAAVALLAEWARAEGYRGLEAEFETLPLRLEE